MSGILDSKTRILDAIVTVEGRRQLSEGTFNVSYATFSDGDVVYLPDETEGHVDPTGRIYLEASNLPQDQVIFEANDSGNLVPLRDQNIDIQRVDSLFPKRLGVTFIDGKSVVTQLNFGARVKVSSIPETFNETNVGFTYSDSKKKTVSVVLDKSIAAGSSSISTPGLTISVGVKGGINSTELTTSIQEAIEQFALGAGPKVDAVDRQNYLYILDSSGSHGKIKTKLIPGSMTGPNDVLPFVIDEALGGGRTDTYFTENNVDFASQITGILTSSFDNFGKLSIISTVDPFFEENKFTLSANEINFEISKIDADKWPSIYQIPSLNSIDSIFNDDKLSNLENFRYLPPIVKVSDTLVPDKSNLDSTLPYRLGDYPPLGDNKTPLTFNQILDQLKGYIGERITFKETTRPNNLLCQIFEVSNGNIRKLDIVEYGDVKNDPNDPSVVSNKVYFVGKTFLDDRGTTCFVNMFTLIFARNKGDEE